MVVPPVPSNQENIQDVVPEDPVSMEDVPDPDATLTDFTQDITSPSLAETVLEESNISDITETGEEVGDVPVAEDSIPDASEQDMEFSPEFILANSSLNPDMPEFVPDISVDTSLNVAPNVVPDIISIPDEDSPGEDADVTILDPAEETFPYEETEALIFDETWFEELDSEPEGEADRGSSESSGDEIPIRRSTRARIPKMVSSHAKPGGELVMVPVGTDK